MLVYNPDVLHNVILVDKLYYSNDLPTDSMIEIVVDDAKTSKLESEFLGRRRCRLLLVSMMLMNMDLNNVEIDHDSNSSLVQSMFDDDDDNLQSFSTYD